MKIILNGKQITVPDTFLISDLLKKYKIEPDTIVIELNRLIIQRDRYSTITLNNEDQIEIVHIVGGG